MMMLFIVIVVCRWAVYWELMTTLYTTHDIIMSHESINLKCQVRKMIAYYC